MNTALRRRLDRLVRRLGPRGALTGAEARELAALRAEFDRQRPCEGMSGAELDRWLRDWPCGRKGARLAELRERALAPEERRAAGQRAAEIAAMGKAELERWFIARGGGDEDGAEAEGPAKVA